MSQPGWYLDPDPQAPHGRLRWWDGTRWSDATQLPWAAPPAPSGPQPQDTRPQDTQPRDPHQPLATGWQPIAVEQGAPGEPGHQRPNPLLGVLATLLVLALVGGVLWWRHSRSASAPEDQNTAAPTVSSWNESTAPTPSASSSGVRPSASGKPLRQIPCPRTAQPRVSHPTDGRLHGGGLVVDLPATFTPQPYSGVDFIGDRANASRALTADKVSLASGITLGSLDRTRFGSVETAADSVLTCVFSYARNHHVEVFEQVLANEATTLQGHPAWHLRETVSSSKSAKPDMIEEIEVVDLGSQQYGMFWTDALTADSTAVRALGSSLATLKVGA